MKREDDTEYFCYFQDQWKIQQAHRWFWCCFDINKKGAPVHLQVD